MSDAPDKIELSPEQTLELARKRRRLQEAQNALSVCVAYFRRQIDEGKQALEDAAREVASAHGLEAGDYQLMIPDVPGESAYLVRTQEQED